MQRVEFSPRRAETELSGISSDERPHSLCKGWRNFYFFLLFQPTSIRQTAVSPRLYSAMAKGLPSRMIAV